MISLESIAFKKGYTEGFKFGMFNKVNPYCPKTHKKEFEEWEDGFSKGYQAKGWL